MDENKKNSIKQQLTNALIEFIIGLILLLIDKLTG